MHSLGLLGLSKSSRETMGLSEALMLVGSVAEGNGREEGYLPLNLIPV